MNREGSLMIKAQVLTGEDCMATVRPTPVPAFKERTLARSALSADAPLILRPRYPTAASEGSYF